MLQQKSALITGVGGGFGRAIALAIARAGASVTMVARSAAEIEAIKHVIEKEGGHALALTADVRDTKAAERVYAAHKEAFGVPHILINSASVTEPYGPIGVVDPQIWWDSVAVHVLGTVNYVTVAIGDMRAEGRGCIINVCSLDGLRVRANQSGYCVAKAAQIRLSEHIAEESAGSGVAVFAVHPGITMSPTAKRMRHSADAARWLPADFMQLVVDVDEQGGRLEDQIRCGERCVALASGKFDHLSGTFVNFHEFMPDASPQSE